MRAFSGIFRRKQESKAEKLWGYLFSSGSAPGRRGTSEILRAYKDIPWLLACASRISMSVASVPWQVFVARSGEKAVKVKALGRSPEERKRYLRKDVGLQLEVLDEHPLLTLLDAGNEFMSGTFVRQLTQMWLDLVGEAFWIKERDGVGIVSALWPIPPTWVLDLPKKEKPFYRVNFNGLQYEIVADDVVWFRYPNPENPLGRGVGFGLAMSDELDVDEFTAQHLKAWFYNRARPDLLIMPSEGAISKEDTERLEQRWLEKTQGFLRSFKPFFATRRFEVKELTQSFAEMQLIDLRRFQRDTVIQVFGIPPELLGIIENSNRATIESADYLFSKWVLAPRLEVLRDTLQGQLVTEFDGRLIIDYISPVAEDKEYVLNVARSAPWALTVDEWREMMGLSPLPDGKGNVFMVPFNLMPQGAEEKSAGATAVKAVKDKPLLSEEQQQKRWKEKVAGWDRWEQAWVRKLKKFFQEQQDEVSRKIREQVKDVVDNLIFDVEKYNEKLTELAKPFYLEIMQDGFEEANRLLGLEYAFDVHNPKVQKWVGNRLKLIKDINETTRNELREALREGLNNGEGVSQLLDRVKEVFDRAKGWRAENIARTETISAYVEGSVDLYSEAGVEKVVFWTAMDERTCEECLGLHGQEYEVRDAHNVIPVHPSCRCDFIPVEG